MTTSSGHMHIPMAKSSLDIPAAQFKAECLKWMDQVEKTREPVVITKHGRPVAQLAPVPASPPSLFGYMKNTLKTASNLAATVDIEWSALSGDEDRIYGRAAKKPSRKK